MASRLWDDRIKKVPSDSGFWLVSQPPFSLVRGHFYVMVTSSAQSKSVDQG